MAEQVTNYFTVQIYFDHLGDLRKYGFLNCTWKTVSQLRRQLFEQGILVAMTQVNNWQLVLPWTIKAFEVYSQKEYFKHSFSDLKQTVFDAEQKIV